MAKVCCATDSVEYPATLRHAIPRFSRYALSRLFVPVAVTHTSFKWLAFPMVFSLTSTLFSTRTSASTLRTAASSAVEKSYFITSPNASYADKSISSPIDFASKKTIFKMCIRDRVEYFPIFNKQYSSRMACSLSAMGYHKNCLSPLINLIK